MTHDQDPEVSVIKLPDLLGDEWRADRDRQRLESRRRYVDHLAPVLAGLGVSGRSAEASAVVLDALFSWEHVTGDDDCGCSCHPRLPESDLHGYGFDCPCQQTVEQRRARWDEWQASVDEFWSSPDGERLTAARQAEEDELHRWLDANPDIEVRTHGGMAPEQWRGTVDGHSFYFRERHDQWRVEVDLRPSGRFYRAWTGEGDLADDANYELRESDEGEVIAEGTTSAPGYGERPVERIQFIAGLIRDHYRRRDCLLHVDRRDDLALVFGAPMAWCPACGTRLGNDR